MISTLVYILTIGKIPPLDSIGRPLFLYGQLIHDNCERRGHFEAGEFVETFGDEASQNRWCLFKMGCKGPQTFAPCPTTRWNGHLSWCVHNGPCIGCAEPAFWDKLTPFRNQSANVAPPGAIGLTPTRIGEALGVATAVGIGAHLIGQAASGRLGRGESFEEKKGTKEFEPGEGRS